MKQRIVVFLQPLVLFILSLPFFLLPAHASEIKLSHNPLEPFSSPQALQPLSDTEMQRIWGRGGTSALRGRRLSPRRHRRTEEFERRLAQAEVHPAKPKRRQKPPRLVRTDSRNSWRRKGEPPLRLRKDSKETWVRGGLPPAPKVERRAPGNVRVYADSPGELPAGVKTPPPKLATAAIITLETFYYYVPDRVKKGLSTLFAHFPGVAQVAGKDFKIATQYFKKGIRDHQLSPKFYPAKHPLQTVLDRTLYAERIPVEQRHVYGFLGDNCNTIATWITGCSGSRLVGSNKAGQPALTIAARAPTTRVRGQLRQQVSGDWEAWMVSRGLFDGDWIAKLELTKDMNRQHSYVAVTTKPSAKKQREVVFTASLIADPKAEALGKGSLIVTVNPKYQQQVDALQKIAPSPPPTPQPKRRKASTSATATSEAPSATEATSWPRITSIVSGEWLPQLRRR